MHPEVLLLSELPWLLFLLMALAPVPSFALTFVLLRDPGARAVLCSGWACLVSAVMARLLAVEALEVRAITDSCDCVFALALLVVLIRRVSLAADEAFDRVPTQVACLRGLGVA